MYIYLFFSVAACHYMVFSNYEAANVLAEPGSTALVHLRRAYTAPYDGNSATGLSITRSYFSVRFGSHVSAV